MQEAEEGELLSRKTHISIPDLLWVSLAIGESPGKPGSPVSSSVKKKKKKRLSMPPAAAFLKVLRQLMSGGLVLAVSELSSKARGRRRQTVTG